MLHQIPKEDPTKAFQYRLTDKTEISHHILNQWKLEITKSNNTNYLQKEKLNQNLQDLDVNHSLNT